MTGLSKDDPAPDRSRVALLVLDLISDFDYEGGDALLAAAGPAAERAAELARRARRAGVPVIYANDNFGRWRDSFEETLEHVQGSRGAGIADRIAPADDDYVILKPRHSAFYGTVLEVLLDRIRPERLVLCGITADMCVLFTAIDAHVRGYRVSIARDAVASIAPEHTDEALALAARVLDAETPATAEIDWSGPAA